ncbi:MAG: CDP-alcohol phosphatidyltransferase family protein [Myxococcota bacterium]
MLSDIRAIYRQTLKKREHPWIVYGTRPFAAVVVYALRNTRVTPNQVTLAAFLTSLVGAAVMLGWTTWPGLLVSVLIYQGAYVLDCADGQLARYQGVSSKAGHLLDFMMDELKAKILYGAVAVRLYRMEDDPLYLLVGVGGVALISMALSLTTFTRRPEVVETTAAAPSTAHADEAASSEASPPPPSVLKRLVRMVEWVAQQMMNYPTYIVLLALFNAIEIYFWLYLAVYAVYTARTFMVIVLKLGRFAPPRANP